MFLTVAASFNFAWVLPKHESILYHFAWVSLRPMQHWLVLVSSATLRCRETLCHIHWQWCRGHNPRILETNVDFPSTNDGTFVSCMMALYNMGVIWFYCAHDLLTESGQESRFYSFHTVHSPVRVSSIYFACFLRLWRRLKQHFRSLSWINVWIVLGLFSILCDAMVGFRMSDVCACLCTLSLEDVSSQALSISFSHVGDRQLTGTPLHEPKRVYLGTRGRWSIWKLHREKTRLLL